MALTSSAPFAKVSTGTGQARTLVVPQYAGVISFQKFDARTVKVRVRTSPHRGSFDVYLGSTKVGHVRTQSSKTRWTWVTLRRSHAAHGTLTLVGTTRESSLVSDVAFWR